MLKNAYLHLVFVMLKECFSLHFRIKPDVITTHLILNTKKLSILVFKYCKFCNLKSENHLGGRKSGFSLPIFFF